MSEVLAQLEKKGGGEEGLDLTGKTRILDQEVSGAYTYTFSNAYPLVIVLVPTLRFEGNTPSCTLALNSVTVSNAITSNPVRYNTQGDGTGRAIATLAILSNIKVGDTLRITCSYRGQAQIYV